jgi:hypothetical protein
MHLSIAHCAHRNAFFCQPASFIFVRYKVKPNCRDIAKRRSLAEYLASKTYGTFWECPAPMGFTHHKAQAKGYLEPKHK